jgi:hypothetical protein
MAAEQSSGQPLHPTVPPVVSTRKEQGSAGAAAVVVAAASVDVDDSPVAVPLLHAEAPSVRKLHCVKWLLVEWEATSSTLEPSRGEY